MTIDRKAAMEYLNENLDTLEDFTKLPDDDHRILKVRELFQVDVKEHRHQFSLQVMKDGVVEKYASAADFARFLNVDDAQVNTAIRRKIKIRGYYLERIPYSDSYISLATRNQPPKLIATKDGVSTEYETIASFCKENKMSRQTVYNGIENGRRYNGYLFERINK